MRTKLTLALGATVLLATLGVWLIATGIAESALRHREVRGDSTCGFGQVDPHAVTGTGGGAARP